MKKKRANVGIVDFDSKYIKKCQINIISIRSFLLFDHAQMASHEGEREREGKSQPAGFCTCSNNEWNDSNRRDSGISISGTNSTATEKNWKCNFTVCEPFPVLKRCLMVNGYSLPSIAYCMYFDRIIIINVIIERKNINFQQPIIVL